MKKKAVCILAIILCLALCLAGCRNKQTQYDEYFKNFSSVSGYASAEVALTLPENVYVTSYDAVSDTYVISEKIKLGDNEYQLYGFSSMTEVYIAPKFTSIIAISGDYAVVTMYIASGDSLENRIGLVKYRGENANTVNSFGGLYGFSYKYLNGVAQYTFLDDKHIMIMGHKESNAVEYNFATLYDYSSTGGAGLLEVARVRNVSNNTLFTMNDGHLVSTGKNVARFHEVTDITDGFLNVSYTLTPFDTNAGFSSEYVGCTANYIGNDWYIISSVYTRNEEYTGYEIVTDDGKTDTLYYMTIKAGRYNARINRYYDINDRIILVANSYSDRLIRDMADAYNSEDSLYNDADGAKPLYFQPVVAMSSAINNNYSIAYYYYYYFVDGQRLWGRTFCLYDQNAEKLDLEELYMPLLFVDGIGLQNADPNFEIPTRSAEYTSFDRSTTRLEAAGDRHTFDTVTVHDNVIMSYRLDLNNMTNMMGAFNKDGSIAIPFKYFELTPFFDGYSTASEIETLSSDSIRRIYYRLDKNGTETRLSNVYALKNGVYITKNDDKYGLYSNSGVNLIPETCQNISVIQSYLLDGQFMKTAVVAAENNRGVIYRLS